MRYLIPQNKTTRLNLMKFGGHQSFHLRDQWLYKGIASVHNSPSDLHNIEKSMENLGLGRNMVNSLKYWLQSTKLIESSGKSSFKLTKIAQSILKHDPYFELDGTLFVIHYLLTVNKEWSTTWHWFFNHFSAKEFDMESLKNSFYSYIQLKTDRKITESTLDKDLLCLLRMYQEVDYRGNKNPETETPSPFSKYGWLKKEGNKFTRKTLSIFDMDINVFSYLIYIFWSNHLSKPKSFQLSELHEKENSVGRIFQFSEEEVAKLVEDISKKTKYLTYSRTGGYFILNINPKTISQSLENYYKEMGH